MTIKCENEKQLRDVLDKLDSDMVYRWKSGHLIKNYFPPNASYPTYVFVRPEDNTITCDSAGYAQYEGCVSATDFCKSDNDPVNHPSHYTQGNIECIDAMELIFGTEFTMHYCLLNVYKYLWRRKDKGNEEQDIQKALWYFDKHKQLINNNMFPF